MGWSVERVKWDELGDLLLGILIKISGFAEVFSTLNDAVADGLDLVIGLDDVEFEKGLENARDTDRVIWEWEDFLFLLTVEFDDEVSVIVADSFDQT